MEGYKLKDLKLKEFDFIQEMFDRAFKRVNTFEDFRTELVEGKEKRAGTRMIQEITKMQKVEDDIETAVLKQLMKIIPDEEEVAIDAIPLAIKSPMIDDLEDLYKLVKAKYESTRLVKGLDLLLWGDLKTMIEPHVEDIVWRKEQEYKVLNWKLYDSCGAHSPISQGSSSKTNMKRKSIITTKMDLEGLETGSSSKTNMKRKRIETSKMDLGCPEMVGNLQELEQAAKSKIFALMWVVQMEREGANDNQIAQKLLDVMNDVDKSLKKGRGIIDELKVKKGIRAWKAVTFYREVEHRDMEMRQQLMLHINKTQMRTFEKREFLEGMKKL
ncbi:hypothetical protein Tco_0217744 [Tanacetum coccineum]